MPDPLPESELSAIAARADAATPGPWELQESHQGGAILLRGTENDNRLRRHPQSHLQIVPRSDAAFIAAARSDVPALVAEVRRLRALLAPAPGGDGEPPRPTDHGGEG